MGGVIRKAQDAVARTASKVADTALSRREAANLTLGLGMGPGGGESRQDPKLPAPHGTGKAIRDTFT